MREERAAEPLIRTVDQLKNTTTSMRGFADSVDHLLNALEEFYPFIEKLEKLTSGTEPFRYPKQNMMRGRGRCRSRF